MTYSIQFVDSIAASPTTRLDLGDGTTWRVLRDGTDFSPPPLRRVIASSMLQDGARIPASVYDLRTITLELILDGSTADAAATQQQTLYRELDRAEGNILRVWENTTNPVFFKTFRASASAVRTRAVTAEGKKWQISLELLAEPFGYGLLQTPVSAATLDTNPANANGNYLDVATVLGDTEAPAIFRFPASMVTANRQTMIAVRQRGTPSNTPFFFQFENLTNGTDTSDQANAAYSGGSGTRTTFATTSMVTRSTLSDLGTAGVDLRGRYRVIARTQKTVSGDNIDMRIQWGTSGGELTTNDTVDLGAVAAGVYFTDLGLIQVPRGEDTSTNPLTGLATSASDTFHLAFQASRSGSGNLDMDWAGLVPADEKGGCILGWVEAGPSYWLLEAEKNKATAWNASDQEATAQPPSITGGLPYLRPGQSNRVYIIPEVGIGMTTTLTTYSPISISYWPRYLRVRPAAT